MEKFDYMEKYGYEQLVYMHDRSSGLKGLICIHNTTLGPALGGTRIWEYANEDDAVLDVLRLARGMTKKAACAGLNLGGGKAVLIGNSKKLRQDTVRREAFWRAYGKYVESLGGRYITAEDVGTTPEDMEYIHMETKHVTGLRNTSGDPSPLTALGVYKGIKACVKELTGTSKMDGMKVAVQGLGHVGMIICKHLADEGAILFVSDIDNERVDEAVKQFNATAVKPEEIIGLDVDIFCPCALGAIINEETIPTLKCKIIAGCANNVLKESAVDGQKIHDMGILYAPDYVINAGGLINVYQEIIGYDYNSVVRQVDVIYDRIREIIRTSKETNTPTYLVADTMAEKRIEMMRNISSIYLGK